MVQTSKVFVDLGSSGVVDNQVSLVKVVVDQAPTSTLMATSRFRGMKRPRKERGKTRKKPRISEAISHSVLRQRDFLPNPGL